jgi:hypothetical protein
MQGETTAHQSDEEAVCELYRQLMDGWNRGSGEDFAAVFTEDGDLVAYDCTHFAGLLMLGLSVGLRQALRSDRGSTWGPRLMASLGLGFVLAGVFPIDPGLGYPPRAAQDGPVA